MDGWSNCSCLQHLLPLGVLPGGDGVALDLPDGSGVCACEPLPGR